MMKFFVGVFVIAAAIYEADSLCNTCSAITGLACVSNTQFAVCSNGLPTSSIISCPTGTVCSAGSQVCSPEGSVTPSCDRCNTCDDSSVFACTGYNTFALCYGSTAPASASFACSGSLVCNIDMPQICVDPSITGIGGSCPSVATTTTTTTTTSAPTTTPNPATNPQAFCASLGSAGRYDITSDATCKSYVYCQLVNGVWVGANYQCAGTTLFNSVTGECGTATPARCA